MPSSWDPEAFKDQLKLTTQRLGQLQDKKDSGAQITRRDIATLLQQNNVSLARLKAHKLIREDAAADLLEILEMYCGVLLQRVADLSPPATNLHPIAVEAIASVLYAAPFAGSKDLLGVREALVTLVGPDLALAASQNTEGHVPPRVLRTLQPKVSAQDIDHYLVKIAQSFNIQWTPGMSSRQKVDALSEMFDPSSSASTIDISTLQNVASSGIPNHPPWLRPRVWKLLLGTLPPLKHQWLMESSKQREGYYDLVRRLLPAIRNYPTPTTPLSGKDQVLLNLFDALVRVPHELYSSLGEEPELSNSCPLHELASSDSHIPSSFNIDVRLELIHKQAAQGDETSTITPEIRLEFDDVDEPEISDSGSATGRESSRSPAPSIIHPSGALRAIRAHPRHVSALLRLLFIHHSLNPAAHNQYGASLLVPLYAVLDQEADETERAHIEADTFWLYEAFMREMSALSDEEEGKTWMEKFSDRLAFADEELSSDLKLKDLDPSQPHYSLRWMYPVLTHTLPLSAVLLCWDAILARPGLSRGNNPRLEYFIDICTAMLTTLRSRLFMLGRSGSRSPLQRPSLWGTEQSSLPSPTIDGSFRAGIAFMDGVALLEAYSLQNAGGIERILQVATEIETRRTEVKQAAPKVEASGYRVMFSENIWKGWGVQNPSVQSSTEEPLSPKNMAEFDKGAAVSPSGLTARLTTAVWKGISNQSAMEAPPSPISPISPSPSPQPPQQVMEAEEIGHQKRPSTSTQIGSSLWSFATKLKDSDMAANLSRASTNFTVKAMDAWNSADRVVQSDTSSGSSTSTTSAATGTGNHSRLGSLGGFFKRTAPDGESASKRDSNGSVQELYSPPPRPAYFRPPRDSWMPAPRRDSLASTAPDSPASAVSAVSAPPQVESGIDRSRFSLPLPAPTPKPARTTPKPLLLKPDSLLTASLQNQPLRSATATPTPGQWTDALRSRVQAPKHRDSQSSISSMSTTGMMRAQSVDSDSDAMPSRIVRLNRTSVSPLAPAYRKTHDRATSTPSHSESEMVLQFPKRRSSGQTALAGNDGNNSPEKKLDTPDSPTTLPSSPPPRTPVTANGFTNSSVKIQNSERTRGSMVIQDISSKSVLPHADRLDQGKLQRDLEEEEASDSSAPAISQLLPTRSATRLLRSKRAGTRPANIGIHKPRRTLPDSVDADGLAAPDHALELDLATTPKASHFPSTSPEQRSVLVRPRKISGDGMPRGRKTSKDGYPPRMKAVSPVPHKRSESAAHEGDDEGYDEILSAYETDEALSPPDLST